MSYGVFILRGAQKELAKLSSSDYQRVCQDIEKLSSNPRPYGSKKLVARPGWRIRVGRRRVIYEINERDRKVVVLHVGLRKDVYR
ncbi:MAG: type II toxin-antitoxin system RelE/ParE family toxin [Candidatus Omnitrophica bacterium]|nr:type II toxin-antitoxin system RelE/ParE family toxin [Candidatus Omnitrophota bacterium]